MSIIVTDTGFGPDTLTLDFAPLGEGVANARGLDVPSDAQMEQITPHMSETDCIRIDFPSFADGRGFTLARRIRQAGFAGRLRARGHVIADQYAMARRVGFDEVEIDADLAKRQPEDQWRFRADTHTQHDYQARLRG